MQRLIRYWRKYRSSSGSSHELATLALCLLLGLLVLPTGIWIVGRIVLGPYANGGLAALLGDYLIGLARGSAAFWLVAAGPYALVWSWRLIRHTARQLRGQ